MFCVFFSSIFLRVLTYLNNGNGFEFVCRVYHSAKVNIYGLPFIREMPKITGVSGKDLVVKCPAAGYPIDKVHWERGKITSCLCKLN